MKKLILNRTYQINLETHELKNLSSGLIKTMEPRLSQLLAILIENQGGVVSRKMLIQEIWGNYGNGDEYLTHSICRLRNLMDSSVIRTIPKTGYVLQASIQKKDYFLKNFADQITFSKAAILLGVLFFLKMLLFPHH